MVRGAIRIAVRPGSSAGNPSAMCWARSQLRRAAAMSRLVAQVAARMCQPYAACGSPAASRCSAISAASESGDPVARFDRGGQPPVQFGAIRLQLRLVGHGADQRMVERVLGFPGERDLIDELAVHQVPQNGINAQRSTGPG